MREFMRAGFKKQQRAVSSGLKKGRLQKKS